ncbi:MAG: hypothetical protein BroJett018_29810 [Chloroflexota bacterium]|nr:MAG: hypothetical protein BroJett018_29810 [Chloroflexota bacterium]
MPNFSFTYYMDAKANNGNRDNAQSQREAFEVWFKALGDVVITPNTPFGMAKTVSANGSADATRADRLTGFCIVKADNLDTAVAMVKDCPFLEIGTIDVAEVYSM